MSQRPIGAICHRVEEEFCSAGLSAIFLGAAGIRFLGRGGRDVSSEPSKIHCLDQRRFRLHICEQKRGGEI